MYTFQQFNVLDQAQLKIELLKCCGSSNWVQQVSEAFPYASEKNFYTACKKLWYKGCSDEDYLEAFTHHPKIGDAESLSKKFANTKEWAGNEQASVEQAQKETIQQLAKANEDYFQKNGFIFIVCATGKSATEMLQLLENRLAHSKAEEILIAKGEQFKITLLRLQKLIDLNDPCWTKVSQITTHVLDTSIGAPGKGICISMKKRVDNEWQTMAIGITNADGRIPDLLPANLCMHPADYVMSFDTKGYFEHQKITGFYPKVDIHFTTFDMEHYHVPLLINPFGYSTYRGS